MRSQVLFDLVRRPAMLASPLALLLDASARIA
jgi:hypothetical protein